MVIVTERLDLLPEDDGVREIQRDENLLLQWPDPKPMNIWSAYDPIGAIYLPMEHIKKDFAPPQGVYESNYIHVEYQNMNGRQPFYHRNTDVDEISYHAAGERQVLTDIGCVDMQVGEMCRIPVGVGHDNRAREDVHLIFYIPNDVKEDTKEDRKSEYKMPPFEGWKSNESAIEFITDHNGSVGSDVSTFRMSEQMLLDNAKGTDERMLVMKSSGKEGAEWLYKAENIWLGFTSFKESDGKVYTRHRKAYEVQIQTKGNRWLITQRGSMQVAPGDAICVPLGTAFSSIAKEENKYITILMRYPADAKKDFMKTAEPTTEEVLKKARA